MILRKGYKKHTYLCFQLTRGYISLPLLKSKFKLMSMFKKENYLKKTKFNLILKIVQYQTFCKFKISLHWSLKNWFKIKHAWNIFRIIGIWSLGFEISKKEFGIYFLLFLEINFFYMQLKSDILQTDKKTFYFFDISVNVIQVK